jgi:hypothetical protein
VGGGELGGSSEHKRCIQVTESRFFPDQAGHIDYIMVMEVVCLTSEGDSNSMRLRLAAGIQSTPVKTKTILSSWSS